MTISAATIENKDTWEDFLKSHPEANFLQASYWGDFHESLGNKVFRTGIYKDKELVGVMLSIIEDAKRGRYLTVPAGPIINWQDKDLVKAFVDEITRIARGNGCIFIRVRPQLVADEFSQNLFKSLGFKASPMHLHAELTNQLDVSKSEEELLAQMRKTTRYEIRKGTSEGIQVTSSTDTGAIKKFYDLQLETAKRQKFVPFSFNFLNKQFEIFSQANLAFLYEARFEEKLLANAFIIFYNDEAVYHYGASTEEGRNHPGAYLIQWEAIKEAKKRGMGRYNFWGVAPVDNPNHRFYKISIFKRGFGGVDVNYLHAQDLVINKSRYAINLLIENTRKKLRGL